VPDDVPTWLECRVWLEPGLFPKFSFPNGPTGSNYRLDMYVKENKYTLLDTAQLAAYENADYGGDWFHLLFFETPRICIHEVEVTGPLNEQWPPPSHRAIFGERPYESAAVGDVLRAFAERAWRRPVTPAEVAPIEELVRAAEAAAEARGEAAPLAAQSAITLGVKAVLCAPEFIYREERGDRLDGHELNLRKSVTSEDARHAVRIVRRAGEGSCSSLPAGLSILRQDTDCLAGNRGA
jgi:hypothetical protein